MAPLAATAVPNEDCADIPDGPAIAAPVTIARPTAATAPTPATTAEEPPRIAPSIIDAMNERPRMLAVGWLPDCIVARGVTG